MTEVAVREDAPADLAIAPPSLPAVAMSSATADAMARLADWATSVTNVSRVINPLIGTPFVPLIDSKGNRRDRELVEAEAIGKVLYGLALGWDPLTSLQQIILVPGRVPSMYAKAKVAQLQSRGYRIRVVELTPEKCIMAGARPGADEEAFVEVTMADAERGEWGKSNDNYRKNPKDMLHWRAAGRLCDQIGADALMGLATTEDVADLPPLRAEATIGVPAAPPQLTGAAIIAHAAAQPTAAAPAAQEPDRVETKPTETERKRLWGRLKAHHLDSAELALEWIGQTLDREVASRDDITRADLELLNAALDRLDQAQRETELADQQ